MTKPLDTFDQLVAGFRGTPLPNTDWHAVLKLANESLTVTTLAARLRNHHADVPDDVAQFLATIVDRNRQRNERLYGQLAETADILSAAGIEAMVIKGAAILATASDRTFGDRIMSDLDLLVAARDFEQARTRLLAAGYQLLPSSDLRNLVAVLGRADHAGTIDLHGRIAGLESVDVTAGARRHHLRSGTTITVPASAVQVLVLLAHDILRGRDYLWGLLDLRHFADIDDLARSSNAPDWDVVAASLPAWMTTALRSQLLAIRRLLKSDIPIDCSLLWRARFNFLRRRLQIAHPRLGRALLFASIAADPFFITARRSALLGDRSPKPHLRHRRKHLSFSVIGKV